MAEVTYYFDGYNSGDSFGFNNPANAVDNNLATFATSSGADGSLVLDSTDAPGTNLGTITKIELRAYGTSSAASFYWGNYFYALSLPASADWGSWSDVTTDYAGNSFSWDDFPSGLYETLYFEGGTHSVAKAELRVTYTPSAAASVVPVVMNQYRQRRF